jgi:hypothetical protein
MTRYWLHDEPVGTDYLALVAFCAARSSGISFALQNEEQFSPLCFAFLSVINGGFCPSGRSIGMARACLRAMSRGFTFMRLKG